MTYRILLTHTKSTVKGKLDPRDLGWFMVYGSGSYDRCEQLVGGVIRKFSREKQKSMDPRQQKRLQKSIERLLDAQLEALKLIADPEMINVGI
jgi:hypothetical protein